ncbi:hypothetical protein NQX30_02110 [Candidatus Persebacteraceae bacterium Df01]|jgi:drug/metabolite transporter (DMT)-like permease|uniref:EamA domain-containing protein n=1 Tax=Candidatus Doriopsillibacter californiensis TaxID=2970740 RepID=A0ABT7QKD8_9GAMM|nr:hypothetical protein [Candidatus Persebacteraceae bacterium Df01]
MELWVPITLFAAAMQTVRTGWQKALKTDMDDYAVTWARFGFALPLAPLYLVLLVASGLALPVVNSQFFTAAAIAGVLQIIATIMLVALFSRREFAVCTAFSKTEAVQVALLGSLFFGEDLSLLGMYGVALGGIGIALMLPRGGSWQTAAIGICSGTAFALTGLFVRQAIFALGDADPLAAAAMTLAVMLLLQTLLLGIVLCFRSGAPFRRLWQARGHALAVGVSGFLGSIGWATAFALTNPAYVKTLAQVELPLAYVLGRTVFREKLRPLEIIAMSICAIAAIVVAFV